MKPEDLIVPKRRRGELSKVLPGFVSHKAFFGSLTGGFTAVALDAKAKSRLVEKIGQIHGSPDVEVRSVVRDWMESANTKTARPSSVSRRDFAPQKTSRWIRNRSC